MTALWAWLDAALLFAGMLAVGLAVSWLWRRGLQQALSVLGMALSAFDGVLVVRLTWAFGTRWVKGRFAWLRRWSHLIAMFTALSLGGALLPLPFAASCLALGFFGLLAIIRQWSWDEEDRAQEVPDQFRRMQGGEDLVNEAMFAGACIFLLTPILFFRLDQAFDLFSTPANLGIFAYAAYTLGEFLKAVPLLDYSEVYELQNLSGVSATSLVGRHATFAFRVLLDLALMSGLIQLIAIMQRIVSGRDIRKLQEALESGNAATVKDAIERLAQLGLRNQVNAQRALVHVLDARGADLNLKFAPLVRERAAVAVASIAESLSDRSLFLTVIDTFRTLLSAFPPLTLRWAMTQNNLGTALRALGGRSGGAEGTARLAEAVEAYRSAFRVFTEQEMPAEWAMTQNNLGTALNLLGERLGGAEGAARLAEAIEAYRTALRVTTEQEMPADWARIQNNLGAALNILGERLGGAEGAARLAEAVEAYRSALRVITEQEMPADWARTQNNLGAVLGTLGTHLGGAEGAAWLADAVEACRAALCVYTEKETPAQWAMAQNTLGNALGRLSERLGRVDGAAWLADAVEAYRGALRVYSEQEMPANWATIQNNLGNALSLLGRRLGGADAAARLAEAIEAYRGALSVRTEKEMSAPWASTQHNLGSALSTLGEQLGGADGAVQQAEAIEAYWAALRVYTEHEMPVDWARTQNDLGSALSTLGEQLGGADGAARLAEAIEAYWAALRVYTEHEMAVQWAATQYNLGAALSRLAEQLGGAERAARLAEAVEAFRAALRVYTVIDEPHYAEIARDGLARAEAMLRKLYE